MSFHGGFSHYTWQQAVNDTYLNHHQQSENIDLQQYLTDGYKLEANNQELIQTISELLCENENYRQDLEAADQAYELAQYMSYVAQSTFETQKHYFQSVEEAYAQAQEQMMRYTELLADACAKTRAWEAQLRFRGYTVDDLNAVLEGRQAMIDEYRRRIGQVENPCWAADVCAWRYLLVEEGEILGEILFRISRAADEMEDLCRSYRQFLADRMDIVSEVGDGGESMWRAVSRAAAGNRGLADLERDLDDLIHGERSGCGLNPFLERNFSHIIAEAQASCGANGADAQAQEESECEYEPPETTPPPSIPITPGGHPNLGEGQMFASYIQPPQATFIGYQNMRDAIVAEEPSISSMCYKSSRFRINAKGELVPIQDPRVHVKEETAPVTEEPASEESNMERQDLQRTSVSRVGAKWWLFLLCIALLWYMRSGGETNHQKLLETNQESTNLRTRIQRNRDSEFEFMQMLAYEMSKRSNIDPMALG
ncbi:hypothetical protein APSETT444_007165 [Aspergillus pseudonomiae]